MGRWIAGATLLMTLVAPAVTSAPALAAAPPAGSVRIPGGRFVPLYGFGKNTERKDYAVSPFWIDRAQVTRRDFLRFVKRSPEWARDRVKATFADASYLRGLPRAPADAPVTLVSWYAASAYCESRGGRLPTVLEWEFVGVADATRPDASRDPAFVERILTWYSSRAEISRLPPAGSGVPNYYGVLNLHGLVWEWTQDFNSVFVSGDNRQDGDKSMATVCGGGATDASTRSDYAAFMRYAMRSSVQAEFSLPNLGFRCAYDEPSPPRKDPAP